MSGTPIPQDEIDIWKAKYTAKGVPSTLLDALIAEAELEWDSTIGYGQYDRLADLTVTLFDEHPSTDFFYIIVLVQNMQVFNGITTTATTYRFSQVPCIPLTAYAFKVANDLSITDAQGFTNLNHSTDETISLYLNCVQQLDVCPINPWSFQVFDINDGFIRIGEQLAMSDTCLQIETFKPNETLTVVNA